MTHTFMKQHVEVEGRSLSLRPILVGQFEFREWTPDNHLRHSRFVALREDEKAREVVRENGPLSN